MTPTPHNSAKKGEIMKTVLMPGDPLRAKYIAEHYLQDAVCVNQVRNMLAYTGSYQGTKISVMGSGMGCPSMGIYSYELYQFYEVERIIRIGSAGSLQKEVNLRDIVAAMGVCTNSNFGAQFHLPGSFAPIADFSLLSRAVEVSSRLGTPIKSGNVLCSDSFYDDGPNENEPWRKMGVLAVEMESAALYLNAARLGKSALCLLTISDHLLKKEALPAQERERGFDDMLKVALETAASFS